MKRTAMSTRELRRVEVFGQVASRSLRLLDATVVLQLSYRRPSVFGSAIGRKEPAVCSIVARGGPPTMPSRLSFANKFCS